MVIHSLRSGRELLSNPNFKKFVGLRDYLYAKCQSSHILNADSTVLTYKKHHRRSDVKMN